MSETTLGFYEQLVDFYHLIFDDWELAIERQARILGNLLALHTNGERLRILDCACGIGTQAIGLAGMGHQVFASDLCEPAVHRAQAEAERRGLDISFRVSDMTSLNEVTERGFDMVLVMDNALPHLSAVQLGHAAAAIASKLKPSGLFVASIRDYDALIVAQPGAQEPAFYGAPGRRRIIHQVWDWTENASGGSGIANPGYVLHLYITEQSDHGWQTHHFVSQYRCLLRQELFAALSVAGFGDVHWLMPPETGFYQPIVLARLSA
jgi:SAM-dependent methyltransferase